MSQARIAFYQQANRFFTFVVWGLFVFSLILASWYNTWMEALIIGLPAALFPTLLANTQATSAATRISFGISLIPFSFAISTAITNIRSVQANTLRL